MGRRVKCLDTGEYSTSDVAYKGNNGKYYSSQAAYESIQKEKDYYKECVSLLCEILGYKEDMPFPTVVPKKLKELKGYGYECVLQTIRELNSDGTFSKAFVRHYDSEYNMCAYYMAIILNRVPDIYRKKKQMDKRTIIEDEFVDLNIVPTVAKNKRVDISRFLEE